MALMILKMPTPYVRGIAAASAVLCLLGGYFLAKWSMANQISLRGDVKEVADFAIGLAPSDPQAHYFAALVYDNSFVESDQIRSLDEYEKATSLLPNNYVLWLELGKARDRSGDKTGAEAAYKKALELAPNYSVARWAYGNALLRHGSTEEGFKQIALAAHADKQYASPAANTAWQIFEGDVGRIRQALGDSPETNIALVGILSGLKRFDEAIDIWSQLSFTDKSEKYRQVTDNLTAQLVEAKKHRLAEKISNELTENEKERSPLGQVENGGFESAIKLKGAGMFEWQIAEGAEPQAGVNQERKHSGEYSLFLKFNNGAAIRQISQLIAVEPGRPYSFNGFYQGDVSGPIAWEVIDATSGKSLGKSESLATAAAWVNFHIDFKVPDDSDGVTLRLLRESCSSPPCPISGRAWFDDFTLTQK